MRFVLLSLFVLFGICLDSMAVLADNTDLNPHARPKRHTDIGQQLQLLGGVVKSQKLPPPQINARPTKRHTDLNRGQQLQQLGGVVKSEKLPPPQINARPKRHTDIGQQLQQLGGAVKSEKPPPPQIDVRPKRHTDIGQQLQLLGGFVKSQKSPPPQINARPKRRAFCPSCVVGKVLIPEKSQPPKINARPTRGIYETIKVAKAPQPSAGANARPKGRV